MTSKTRVLLVEDDTTQRKTIGSILAQVPGVEVDVAPDALEALRLLRLHQAAREPYHLLVTDQDMEPIRGAELLARTAGESPGTMRVMMSASPDAGDDAEVERLAHAFLEKPPSAERLRLMVELASDE